MYKVKVTNTCSCFLKSGLPQEEEYDTEEEAQKEANAMMHTMNSEFCHKHEFILHEQFGDFTISMRTRL